MHLSVVQVIGNVAVGGAERHVLDLVDGLQRELVDVRVICPRQGPLTELLQARGIAAQCVEMVRPQPGDEYGLDWSAVEQLADWFRAWQPDVVHSHLYPAHLHASLAAVQTGVHAVVHTAHTLIVRPGDVLLGRLSRARTIATSGAVADLVVGAGVPRESVELIYNGIGPAYFDVDGEAVRRTRAALNLGDGPIIGTVARLSHEKGVDQLLRALPAVAGGAPDVTALVVGDGPQAPQLQQLARQLGVAERVRFLGTRDDVAVLNHLFDVFVLPSREEACPMALLEALAAGTAVLATRVGGSPELIIHEIDGMLVASEDPPAMARCILQLLANPPVRASLGAAARAKVAQRFTLARMVTQTLEFYRNLLSRGENAFGTRPQPSGSR